MKHNWLYYFIASVCITLIVSCGANNATIGIDPNQSFILGEKENSSFKAKVTNLSDQVVQIKIINTKSGEQTQGFGLDKKGNAQIYVSEEETALLINNSSQLIKIKANLSKSVEGMRYTANSFIKGRDLKRDSLIKDVNLLEQALTELHPGIYRYNTPEEFSLKFEKFKQNLPENITENDFLKRLAQLIVEIKCGHTYLNPWNMNAGVRDRLYGNKQFFPLGFKIVNGRFFITENASEDQNIQRGAEIFSINGIDINTIYEALKTISKSDGNNTAPTDHYLSLQHYETRYWNAFDIYFPLFFPLDREEYQISYRNPENNGIQKTRIEALTKEQRAEKMAQQYGAQILESSKWTLDILSDDLAVIKLGTFATWNWKGFDTKKWFASAFAKVDSLHIENLAIDLRGNGGGLSEPSNELISYFIKDTLKCEDAGKVFIRTIKINPELLPHMKTWAKPLIEGLPSTYYKESQTGLYEFKEPSECVDIQPKKKAYDGRVYLFGNASNVSATFTLLDKAKQNGFATYVGQPSGGNKQGINGGEYAFFTLPYSKMEVDIPLKFFAPTLPQEDKGVAPDIPIKLTQEDIAKNRDPYLEYVKSKI